ncbi:uncharacterized protein LOC130614325 [Hydractinia symbiolongicarpus]|uniref:uncharacterized protein LOC130614325 n=1 Tax=Hydractinia symbiolongicarpus TaxID=13093 RepID=UPI00254F77F3|nr:uncharacterized protein LOC130614325 [Hydractinia symbiolongicarpus]XP_057291736.1 uncharacterized protein LOC130614325 [Hydractinia symbiolongicarpus]
MKRFFFFAIFILSLSLCCAEQEDVKEVYEADCKEKIHITLQVQFEAVNKTNPQPLSITVDKGTYAVDAFLAVKDKPCYNLHYTLFKYGAFIDAMCNVRNNSKKSFYWMFYINNKLARVGVSCYEVKKYDVLTMRYVDTLTLKKTHKGCGQLR